MKILLVAKPWKGGLGRYFFLTLQAMFPGQVEWISTRPQGLAEKLRFRRDPEVWWRERLQKIENINCDAAFFIGWRKEFRHLKPHANYVLYIVDDVRLVAGEAGAFGRVFLSDAGYENELRAALNPLQYGGILPFAHYPPLHRPTSFSGKKHNLCFIGNRDVQRDPYLQRLFDSGLHPLVVGNYFLNSPLFWQHPVQFRPATANEGMGAVYARHKVSLNIHAQVVREGTNMRSFECAGYGIPQVIEYRKGIDSYFTPDREILCFRNADEMVAQIHSLLNDPARARDMSEAARCRALVQHTYHHRVAAALGHLLSEEAMRQALDVLGKAA